MNTLFRKMAAKISYLAGTPYAFLVALGTIIVWALTGKYFDYSDTWQLVINTGTTIITFLMVFLIQNTQNRDSKALHLKLDELIRSGRGASNSVINAEDLEDGELEDIHRHYHDLHLKYQEALRKRQEKQGAQLSNTVKK